MMATPIRMSVIPAILSPTIVFTLVGAAAFAGGGAAGFASTGGGVGGACSVCTFGAAGAAAGFTTFGSGDGTLDETGAPQCGQLAASVDRLPLHSLQVTRAMIESSAF